MAPKERQHRCCKKEEVKMGAWSPDEDEILRNHILANGVNNWITLAQQAGLGRCAKSCRLRWMNYLRPDLKRGPFSPDETRLILQLHQRVGNKWSFIASKLPGRSDNEIKNFWNTNLKRGLISPELNQQNVQAADSINNNLPPPTQQECREIQQQLYLNIFNSLKQRFDNHSHVAQPPIAADDDDMPSGDLTKECIQIYNQFFPPSSHSPS